VTIDGEPTSDPTILDSGQLEFRLADLLAGENQTLRYRMRVTVGALYGKGINVAVVQGLSDSGLLYESSPSQIKVNVERLGVLSDEATVFGKVFVDSSCDNLQNSGEWPIGGVRLYLQDGTFTITDADGQYSITGLQPQLHTIKIDSLTMPDGLALKPLDTAHAADAQSRFIDLSAGDFHRADFAAACPTADAARVFNELNARNRALHGEGLLSHFYENISAEKGAGEIPSNSQPDGDLSSGGKTSSDVQEQLTETVAEQDNSADEISEGELSESEKLLGMEDPKLRVKTATKDEAVAGTWLWPRSQYSTDGRFMAVIRAGMEPTLYVNDKPVADSQVGERIVNTREDAEVIAWYGVELAAGANDLQIRAMDAFNNERVLASATFDRPAAGVRMVLRAKQDTLPADNGRSQMPIDILITDANDLPAAGVYYATLQVNDGDFVEPDLQRSVPGVQIRVENGRAKVHLRSGDTTGVLRLQANSGALQSSMFINQVVSSRPLIGTGFIQLGASIVGTDSNDNRVQLGEEFEVESRVALFLNGQVRNNLHLVMSYDTDKPENISLLRDSDPQELYSLVGDASDRGYEARSRSRLFLKLSRDRHSVMWGDYLTDAQTQLDDLARVQRTLTGFNALLDTGKTQLRAFAALESNSRESEEFRGNGTALLYQLSGAPIVANSEVVEVIVRDRNNPGIEISREPLVRISDYTLDALSGLLSFSNAIASVDDELNPVFIRISYDRESNLSEHRIAGLRIQRQLGESSKIGLSLTDDAEPLNGFRIAGIQAESHFTQHSSLSATIARQIHTGSESATKPDGQAQRLKLFHQWKSLGGARTSLQWARANEYFENPGAGILSGRQEWQFEHVQPIGKGFEAKLGASQSESDIDESWRKSAFFQLSKTWRKFALKSGFERINTRDSFAARDFSTVLVGAERRFQIGKGKNGSPKLASVAVEYELDVADAARNRRNVTMRVPLHDVVTAYTRYEEDSGIGDQSIALDGKGITQITAGIESDYLPSTRLYSEYRLRGAFSGRSMETASGVSGRFVVREGLSISPSLELISALEGEDTEDSLAISLGVRDTHHINRRIGAQLEWRKTESSRYIGFRTSLVQRLDVKWTAMIKDQFTRQSNNLGESISRHELNIGLSRRPKTDNRHHSLYALRFNNEEYSSEQPDTSTWVASTLQNRAMSADWTLSGRIGFKHRAERSNTVTEPSTAWLADLRSTVDIGRRWEADLRTGVLATQGLDEALFSLGVGVSWLAEKNLRVSASYNALGFTDSDLDRREFNVQGLKFGLTYKFDESQFDWLEPEQ